MEFNKGQKKIINSKPNGHMLIKGIEGAGKTTAFVNKIPSLLNHYCIAKDDKILVVTHNEEISKNISFIYENIEEEKYHQNSFFDTDNKGKLEIKTINSLISYYFNLYISENNKKITLALQKECRKAIEKAIKTVSKKYEKKKFDILNLDFAEFIQDEVKWIKACNYVNLEEYQNANRSGRTSKLAKDYKAKVLRKNSKQRQAIFEILIEYNKNLKKINKIDSEDMILLALKGVKTNNAKGYSHVFIDDSQLYTKVQLEFLKALYNEKTYSSITFIVDNIQNNNPYAWLIKGRSFVSLGYDMKGKSISLNKPIVKAAVEEVQKLSEREIEITKKSQKLSANEILINMADLMNDDVNKNKLKSNENSQKEKLIESDFTLDYIEYVDLKKNVSHKFIKDPDSNDEIYIEYDGTEEKVDEVVNIPLFNEIAAGSPILINESIEDKYSLPKEWIRSPKDVFMLKVKGDSMINKNINDGDYVVISKQNVPNVKDVVAVDIEGEATLKTYQIVDGKITLTPANDKYEPIIIEDQQFCFLGVAIGLVKNSLN